MYKSKKNKKPKQSLTQKITAMEMKSYQEMREKVIDLLVFNCKQECGLRRFSGEREFAGAIDFLKQLFGTEEYNAIATEAMRRINTNL